jgi:hypothetical protein
LICSFNFLIFLAVCLNISTVINIKILTNSSQQTQSYKFTSNIVAFLSVVLITERLEICIQISYDQIVQLILKSYLPVVYGTTLRHQKSKNQNQSWLGTGIIDCIVPKHVHHMCTAKLLLSWNRVLYQLVTVKTREFRTKWTGINLHFSFTYAAILIENINFRQKIQYS